MHRMTCQEQLVSTATVLYASVVSVLFLTSYPSLSMQTHIMTSDEQVTTDTWLVGQRCASANGSAILSRPTYLPRYLTNKARFDAWMDGWMGNMGSSSVLSYMTATCRFHETQS